jgi:uncharacterized protein YndB with AHSA1/START domain
MLRFVSASAEFYEQVLSAFPDTESLTVLVASGVTREAVLEAVAADVSHQAEDAWDVDEGSTAWAAIEVPGGVLAIELSGYGDPSTADLASLSTSGASAVARSNIQAHYRFGCARAGEVVFDDDEFTYVTDRGRVPSELRALFDAAWDDLDGDDDEDGSGGELADPFATALAMAELVTGLEITDADVAAALESPFFAAPSLRYPGPGADAPPVGLFVPEQEEGIAAAARIGRDVEGDPGARKLSGELGSVTVERTLEGTRRKLFRDFAYVMSWSAFLYPSQGSWMFGGAWVDYELGEELNGYSADHPDQLTGRRGTISFTFVEVEKPARVVRRWNWLRPTRPDGVSGRRDGVPVLVEDSVITTTLVESRPDGVPWTTVRMVHSGLPVEWLDDMTAYWNMQLAIADAARFGTSKR